LRRADGDWHCRTEPVEPAGDAVNSHPNRIGQTRQLNQVGNDRIRQLRYRWRLWQMSSFKVALPFAQITAAGSYGSNIVCDMVVFMAAITAAAIGVC
jgi:hypothetical protein